MNAVESSPGRVVVSVIYAIAVVGAALWFGARRPATIPLAAIALGLPLVFKLVPRNRLYGLRTPRTLRSDEATWYRQNTIGGIVMVTVGIVWLVVIAVR
jgi:hypothetical protein